MNEESLIGLDHYGTILPWLPTDHWPPCFLISQMRSQPLHLDFLCRHTSFLSFFTPPIFFEKHKKKKIGLEISSTTQFLWFGQIWAVWTLGVPTFNFFCPRTGGGGSCPQKFGLFLNWEVLPKNLDKSSVVCCVMRGVFSCSDMIMIQSDCCGIGLGEKAKYDYHIWKLAEMHDNVKVCSWS